MGVIIFGVGLLTICLIFYIVAEVKQRAERKERELQEKFKVKKEYVNKANIGFPRSVRVTNTTPKKVEDKSTYHNTRYVMGIDPYESITNSWSNDNSDTHFSGGFGGGGFSGGGAGYSWGDSSSSDSSSYDSGSSDSSSSSD